MPGLKPTTMTYGELAVAVKRAFGDESGVQLEDGDILRWANDAQREIVNRNGVLRRKSSTATVIGQADYTFATLEIHRIVSLELAGQLLPNVPFEDAERRIMDADPDRVEEGDPLFWYEWAGEFSFWPKPNAVKTVVLRYIGAPTKLTGTQEQVLSLPDEYFPTIVDYILTRAYEMDEDWTAVQQKQTAFDNSLALQNGKERVAQDATYGVIAEVC